MPFPRSGPLRPTLLAAVAVLALSLFGIVTRVAASARPAAVPAFQHAVLVVFENRSARQIFDNPAAAAFQGLAEHYATFTHYDAVAHPSLPNYLALVSGSTHGIRRDCRTCVVSGPSLADTLTAHSLTWKMYVENLPPPRGRMRATVKARLPFLYFRDVLRSRRQMRSIVPLFDFFRDLETGNLPSFSLVIPDLCHDMHSCPTSVGNAWLSAFLPRMLHAPGMDRSVVFVVFDEGRGRDLRGGGGRIPAIAAGPLVRPDSVSSQQVTHYSLLRTIEDAWHLPLLGKSAFAQPITGIWRGT